MNISQILHKKLKGLIFLVPLCALVLGLAAGLPAARAADKVSIKMIVNGAPITTIDLENRTRLLALLSGIAITAENRPRLETDALDMLTDEMLKLQAAENLPPETQSRARQAARQLMDQSFAATGMPANQLLREKGISVAAALEKFYADIVWVSVLNRKFPRQFENVNKLADQQLARLRDNQSEPQFNLSEIVLAPTPSRNPAQLRELASQIRQAIDQGADFAGIARQYSSAGSSRDGGRIGWIPVSNLPANFVALLEQAENGQVLGPLEREGALFILRRQGYRALGFLDPGRAELQLSRILAPLDKSAGEAALATASENLQKLTGSASSCADIDRASQQLTGKPAGNITLAEEELEPALRSEFSNLETGAKTGVLRFDDGLAVIMVCSRTMPAENLPPIENIRRAELDKLFSALNSRYLMRLRRAAVIEKPAE